MLYRQLPKVRRYLAYLPEGPLIDWTADDIGDWLTPMADHLRSSGAFGIRIGCPVVVRRWHAATIKAAIADERVARLSQALPDEPTTTHRLRNRLRELGWRPPSEDEGFAAGPGSCSSCRWRKTPDELLAGMNQLWRRNIKKAAKVGVQVTRGDAGDLPAFHGST